MEDWLNVWPKLEQVFMHDSFFYNFLQVYAELSLSLLKYAFFCDAFDSSYVCVPYANRQRREMDRQSVERRESC